MKLDKFLHKHMKKGGRPVPARLQAALALLEKLRDKPSLTLEDHLSNKGSAGLESHETYGNRAHERLSLEAINKNHGRRSCNLQDWGQDLLDDLKRNGFEKAGQADRLALITLAQEAIGGVLRSIVEQGPLEVHIRRRTVEAVIADVLKQAEEKNKAGDVAQYLVGAKLMLRFNRAIPILPANKGDRKSRSDPKARLGDFQTDNTVIEVALGLPDDKHLGQIAQALDNPELEFRLLTRDGRVDIWRAAIDDTEEIDASRVAVSSVVTFVGQNIWEQGELSSEGRSFPLLALFDLYNKRWNNKVGTPGIAIIVK